MSQQPKTKDIQVQQGDAEIPDEITHRKSLNQAASAGITPNALLIVHGLALLVESHNPQRQGVDENALDERDDVGVPVGLLRAVVARVELREQPVREHRRHDNLGEGVEEGGGKHLVDVQGESWHGQPLGERLDRLA
jgi:hypothetical protein